MKYKIQFGSTARHALQFASLSGGWHTFDASHAYTMILLSRLAMWGLIEINNLSQFRKI